MKGRDLFQLVVRGILFVFLFLSLSSLNSCDGVEDDEENPANYASPMATNLYKLSYFNASDWLLVDQYTKSSRWYPYSESNGGWDQGTIVSTDLNGWPTGIEGDTMLMQQMLKGIEGHYPSGSYVLYWEGSGGTFVIEDDASNLRCEDGQPITNCPSKRAIFDVNTPSDNGIFIEIYPDSPSTYSSSNYLKNFRVIMPGGVCGRLPTDLDYTEYCQTSRGGEGTCDEGETCYDFDEVQWNRYTDPVSEMHNPKVVFHPKSLKLLERYRGIRMMDLQMIQSSPVSAWSDRALVTQYSLGLDNGAPPEYQVALANILHANPWFNMPHLATDNFVNRFSTLVYNLLDPGLDLSVEYTNEHFNTDPEYSQSTYMLEQANALGIGVGETDEIKRSMYYATRAVEIFDLWQAVFGSDIPRVKRVLATFTAIPATATTMLELPGIASKVDALAIGPYFAGYLGLPEVESTLETWNLDQLFEEINTGSLLETNDESENGAMAEVYDYIDAHIPIADSYGLDLVAYEGGQHLVTKYAAEGNTALETLFRNANKDQRMGAIYTEFFNYWKNVGEKRFYNYDHIHSPRFGTFGSLEYIDSPPEDSPKYTAIHDFIDANDCWWDGCE